MTIPSVLGTPTETTDTAPADANVDVNLPATIVADNLLVMVLASMEFDADPNWTVPDGWTALANEITTSALLGVLICYKVATGSEGSTVTVTAAATPTAIAAQVWQFFNWEKATPPEEAGTYGANTTNSPDPPPLTASWNPADSLSLAVTPYCDDGGTVTAYPSGYTGGVNTVADGGTNASVCIGAAYLELTNDADENPGNFTLSESERWGASTILIKGGTDGGDGGGGAATGRGRLVGGKLVGGNLVGVH